MNWFQHIADSGAYFVTRLKDNVKIEFLGQHREANEKRGGLQDEAVWFTGYQSARKYPGELRRIEFRDESTGKNYRFITNNFKLAAASIAGIYSSGH